MRTNKSTQSENDRPVNFGGYYILALIRDSGTTVTRIAAELGVTQQFVSLVIHGHRPTQYVREAIAEAVNKPVGDLWPDTNTKEAA